MASFLSFLPCDGCTHLVLLDTCRPNAETQGSLKLESGCLNPLALGCFYRPPAVPSQSVIEVCDNMENMMLSYKYVVVCGDLTIVMLDLSKCHSKTLQNFITYPTLLSRPSLLQLVTLASSSASILNLYLVTPDFPFLTLLSLTLYSLTIFPSY